MREQSQCRLKLSTRYGGTRSDRQSGHAETDKEKLELKRQTKNESDEQQKQRPEPEPEPEPVVSSGSETLSSHCERVFLSLRVLVLQPDQQTQRVCFPSSSSSLFSWRKKRRSVVYISKKQLGSQLNKNTKEGDVSNLGLVA